MDKYSWKIRGLIRGVDPHVAVEEIKRLQELHGVITADILVKEASNVNSVLHPAFEWDDKKAAAHYRLQQARVLLNNIQVTTVRDGEEKRIAVYEVVSHSGGYKHVNTFTPEDIAFVRESVSRQISILKDKLKFYKEFEQTIVHLTHALEAIYN